MDDPNISWKTKKPNYDAANALYMKGKTTNHAEGSLEKLVENLVKTWEMESTHKIDEKDWGTIDKTNYTFNVNGIRSFTIQDNIRMGNYNMMMYDSPIYDVSKETNESSHSVFKTAFPTGFAWEVLELYSGPPKVAFKWRHWAEWTGPYREHQPTGETIELYGMCVATVNDDLKIQTLDIWYDPNPFLMKLSNIAGGQASQTAASKCPAYS
ncbi:uncharacterized protein LOC141901232 [Tubulanus polymorphus]|uniref:uncharacterized protein LOC141901232 n=1 Tax=Tubulanus polymorphus TaxID=672921 RepID=UPI003DA34E2A